MTRLRVVAVIGLSLCGIERIALGCGCLAMPSPTQTVVQAGERILFAQNGPNVTAYIQIQYSGSANDFAWLLPLPSVPTLQTGTDELFTKLGQTTQPNYQLTTQYDYCNGGSAGYTSSLGGCGSSADSASYASDGGYTVDQAAFASADLGSVLVSQSSIGPYDYAVLHADDQTAMTQWLNDNRYFVPGNTSTAITPYIHPGAYFLALKLHAGEPTGAIVPIIVSYQSDLPMIPIILTQVGAVPDMGVQVWVLGQARAFPRNYYHTVLDDLAVWLNSDGSYNNTIIRATKEAPKRHTFLTEYAGTSLVMQGQLFYPGRFGDPVTLKAINDPAQYIQYLLTHGFTLDSTLISILQKYIPEPAGYYSDVAFYTYYNDSYWPSSDDAGAPLVFDPSGLTDAITAAIVQPTIAADQLFQTNPYLTRLYTTLSPEDMTADPVFSQNPDLPDVNLVHSAKITVPCSGRQWIHDDGTGFEANYPNYNGVQIPASLRIETILDTGAPKVVTDNSAAIQSALGPVTHDTATGNSPTVASGPRGCACDTRGRRPPALDITLLMALSLIALGIRRYRKLSSSAKER